MSSLVSRTQTGAQRRGLRLPNSLNGAYWDGSFEVLSEDGERVLCRGWRLGDDGNARAVLVVLPTAEHPSPSNLDRLAHEYGLKNELDGAWAAQPLELVHDGRRPMLVLEDAGGEPLDRLLGAPMDVGRFLRAAIGIAVALGQLHVRGLVHKDVKPANILLNSATGEVRLTGFGIASRLSRQRQASEPPDTLSGTLAYMAPEQTGRMNRSIDSRSDLYALGVVFYEMLTGVLPFTATDPIEWVHCHLAKRPLTPADRVNGIPDAVSEIVMKLLAKTAEDRYQTAAGVEHDLQALSCRMGAPRARRALCARRTRQARSAHDPGEALRERARGRVLARRLRSRGRERRAGIGFGFGLFRHRQIVRRQRAAQGACAAARDFCLRQVRSAEARHPLFDARSGL